MREHDKPLRPELKAALDGALGTDLRSRGDALYRVLSKPTPQSEDEYPAGSKESLRAAQRLSGGTSGWRDDSPTTNESANRLKNLIRPNVQQLVGIAWAEYMLHGVGGEAGVVDWISEAITAKLATNPEFFQGGDSEVGGSYGGSE